MRLDKYLVLKGYFSSRERAKEAIKKGFVLVDGLIVRKPSFNVTNNIKVEVYFDVNKPRGFWKLMNIDDAFKLFKGNEVVLDIGSSAGGFLQYASEKSRFVFGIEVSERFKGTLKEIERKKKNVKIFIEDAFKFDVNTLPILDLILLDVSLDPEIALKILIRFLPKLKVGGKVLFVVKTGEKLKVPLIPKTLKILNLLFFRGKKEIYALLMKVKGNF